ncbi:MAG: hypothetical protein HFF15_03950 [Angelakisella sp.]|nr:hypothetical protein [Angelakisella sp.]
MNRVTTKLATAAVIFVVLTFVLYQGWRSLSQGYKTETAYEFEIARYCNTEGLLIRTEEVIQKEAGGQVRYLLEEGEKFRSDTPIAQLFPSQEAAEEAARQEVLRKERDLLEAIQRSTDTSRTADVETLNKEIALSLRRLTKSAEEKDMEAVSQLYMTLVEKIGRQQLATGQSTGFGERIRELQEQLTGNSGGQNLYSPQIGYFSRYVDGYEGVYTPDMLDQLDAASLGELLDRDYRSDPGSFGKSVTDFTWYYAALVPKESAEFFYEGARVTMTFNGSGEQTVPGKVIQVKTGENGATMAVIQSTSVTADTVSHRTAGVRVDFSSYKGLRIPRKALRILDGQKGVYVKSGYSVRFKTVDILYTGSDYYLCRTQYSSSSQLSFLDEVIVEGTDLYDGKPINP